MRKFIAGAALLAALSFVPQVRATDYAIYPTGAVYRLTNLQWGVSGGTGFNNNFFFTPTNVNENVCVYVYNNNPTNAHSFTLSILLNGNPANTSPSDAT